MATVTYIVDDRDPALKYLCSTVLVGGTSTTQLGDVDDFNYTFYNGTSSTVANDTDCSNGWFQYTFNGTAVDVPVTYSQPTTNYSLTLDGNKVVPLGSSLADLPDEEHTIVYATAANASLSPTFDYLTVVAGTSTKMKGRNVILDDGDSAITYTGGWRPTNLEPATFPNGRGVYKDTVHFTGRIGDTLSFEFPGGSVFIYALLPFSQTGSVGIMECSESLDSSRHLGSCLTLHGLSNNDTNSVGVSMIGGAGGWGTPGMYRMTVNVTDVTDDYSIGFDFATYEATFDTIDGMPSAKSNKHVGAIVGGVIGGLAFIGLVILALVWWRRRQGSRLALKSPHAGFGGSDDPVDSDMEKERS